MKHDGKLLQIDNFQGKIEYKLYQNPQKIACGAYELSLI